MKSSSIRRSAALLALVVITTGCSHLGAPPSSSCSAIFGRGVVYDVYFGQSLPGGGVVEANLFDEFILGTVVPRFPDGFSLFAATGFWRGDVGTTLSEPSVILRIAAPAGDEAMTSVYEIAQIYRQHFKQEAVLVTQQTGSVSLCL